ncbi:MAG TPA: metallophosphoesterase family protein [Ramlibacter sp.]|nr:metallophosphoesterase family protein [Ramlibacter sp.]
MKLALLADIHANLHALQACLADARRRAATQYAFLGDLVGYGADPVPVLETVIAMADDGAWVLRGNHDDLAVGPAGARASRTDAAGADWTAARLDAAHREFIAKLPMVIEQDFFCLVHASMREPARWEYVNDTMTAAGSLWAAEDRGRTHVFGGHVHEQRLFFQGAVGKVMPFEPTPNVPVPVPRHRRWLATVGSVGQPRDGRSDAMYAVFDTASLQLTFVRVPYDHHAAARAISDAGLPEFNGRRLAVGQ